MIVDVLYLNEKLFWDLMFVVSKLVIVFYFNVRSLCDVKRNFIDN